jgi:predicted acyl esterase
MTRAVLDERANRGMLNSPVLRACCVVALTVLAPAGVRAADRYEVILESDVQAKMRDGITLRSDVCRPMTDGKFPVLLTRTPYDKKWDADICLKWAARGYVVVAQVELTSL